MDNVELSVVVIARNEEETIDRALGSCLAAVEEAKKSGVIDTAEVIFVDSASTDKTLQIAKKYPVTVLQLEKEWPLSAAAGIFSGFKAAKGVFFAVVDGDVEVDRHWFADAIPYLRKYPGAAAVYGAFEEHSQKNTFLSRAISRQLSTLQVTDVKEVEYVGNGVFLRSALEQVGAHNPYLKGAEDKDISLRLRQAGFKLLQIPVKFGIHYWHLNLFEYYKSVRSWSIGEGHAAAYAKASGNTELFQLFARRYSAAILWRMLRHLGLMLIFVVSLILAILFGGLWRGTVFIWGVLFISLLLVAKRKDPLPWKEFLFNYFHRIPYFLVCYWFFYRGLRLPTLDPRTYPEVRPGN